jgi:hypothetical protein
MDYSVIIEMEKVNAQTYFSQVRSLIEEGNLTKMKEFSLNHLDEMPNIANYITHNRSNWNFDIIELLLSNKPHLHSTTQWLEYFYEELKVDVVYSTERNNYTLLQYTLNHCNRLDNIKEIEKEIFDVFKYLLKHSTLAHNESTNKIASLVWQSKSSLRKIILPLFEENKEYQKQISDGLEKKGVYKNNPLLFDIIHSHYSSSHENFLEFYDKFKQQIDLTIHGAPYNHNIYFTLTHGVRNKKSHELFVCITELLKKQKRLDLFYEVSPQNETVINDLVTFLLLAEEKEVHRVFQYIIDNFTNLTPLILHEKKEKSIYQSLSDYPSKRKTNKLIILDYLNIILEKEKLDNEINATDISKVKNKL